MRDVNNGWLIRYLHSNTASAFFFIVYLHIGRGLYYGSYRAPRTLVWTIGTVIFILMMASINLAKLTIFYGLLTIMIATSFALLLNRILLYIKGKVRINILKSLIIIWSINFCLKFPMGIFCEKLGIMYIYFIWCGFVACISYMVILNLNEKQVTTNWSLFIIFFISISCMFLLHWFVPAILLLVIYNFFPEIWETFMHKLSKYIADYYPDVLIMHMAPVNPIAPQDPSNQLVVGYDPNGTNQPIGRNIASELQQLLDNTRNATLSGKSIPRPVQGFIESHLQANDPELYNKLQEGRTPGQRPKWWNLNNTVRLRDGLYNLN